MPYFSIFLYAPPVMDIFSLMVSTGFIPYPVKERVSPWRTLLKGWKLPIISYTIEKYALI